MAWVILKRPGLSLHPVSNLRTLPGAARLRFLIFTLNLMQRATYHSCAISLQTKHCHLFSGAVDWAGRKWGVLLGHQTSKDINWCNLLDKYYKVYCRAPVFTWLSQVFCKSYHVYIQVISVSNVHMIACHSIRRECGLDIVHLRYRGVDKWLSQGFQECFLF